MGWFLVDKLGGGGLDDWEVKIADFVVLLGKDAKTVRVVLKFTWFLWHSDLTRMNRDIH